MLVLFGTETPMPTPSMTVDPNSVTPGPAGFAVIVIIVIIVILLIWDMNRRIRRVRYREEVREELDAEEAALNETQSPDAAASAEPEVDDVASDEENPPPGR